MHTPRRTLSYRAGEVLVHSVNRLLVRHTWRGREHIPSTGGVLVAVNHISYSDPFIDAEFLSRAGRLPRFMAKESILALPVAGALLARAGQIPVQRMTAGAADAFEAAVGAVLAGECVVIYPEGTLTRDPDLWPMRGKSGAARIALATGCPIVPVVKWGTQHLLPPYSKRLRLFPRTPVTVVAGEPILLPPVSGEDPPDAETLARATNTVIDTLTMLLAGIRDEPAPRARWDPQHHGQPEIGNFKKPKRTQP